MKARYELGLALYGAGQYTEAVKVLTPVATQYPRSPQTYCWFGYANIGAQRFTVAIKAFRHITGIPHVSAWYTSEAYDEIGHCYYDIGDYRAARLALQRASQYTNNPDARRLLGFLPAK
jgi:tetratricopeptide (TPR) repeat protein